MSAPQQNDDGVPVANVAEQVEVWRGRLTKEQKADADAILRREGWVDPTMAPPYVWALAFNAVDP